jgi:Alpha-glucosidases, family 31 of glycosyl hydrolases
MYRISMNMLAGLLAIALVSGCSGNSSSTQTAAPHDSSTAQAKFQQIADGVIVDTGGAAKQVRLEVVGDKIIHVTAIPGGGFDLPASLMAVKSGGDKQFTVSSEAGHVRLKTTAITADVAIATGDVQFLGNDGKVILAEQPNGRTFTPTKVDDKAFYAVRQQFASPDDEAFYGLGQHQKGTMNYKGKDVELAQHNMDIGIPFVVSSRNYGLLWDNNSITRFGDPRPYQMLDKQLKLFDADGKPGGFTANYYVDGKLKLSRVESAVNYEYIKDLKHWPDQLKDDKGITGGPGQTVEWKGAVASDVAGLHKFSPVRQRLLQAVRRRQAGAGRLAAELEPLVSRFLRGDEARRRSMRSASTGHRSRATSRSIIRIRCRQPSRTNCRCRPSWVTRSTTTSSAATTWTT